LRQLITGALVVGSIVIVAVMVFLLLTMAGVGGDMLGWWDGWAPDY
jgi:hypothetical protein